MIRRSFRVGLTLGVLGGLVVALVRAMQSRNSASQPGPAAPSWSPAPQQWAPPRPTPAPTPAPQPSTPADPARGANVPVPEPSPPEPVVPEPEPEPILPEPKPEPILPDPAPEVPPPAKAAAKKAGAAKKAPAAKKAAPAQAWIEPEGLTCPGSHPIKAKLSSKIFQLPGMFAYDRTKPDRCYATEEDATGDGFRKAKR